MSSATMIRKLGGLEAMVMLHNTLYAVPEVLIRLKTTIGKP